MPTYDRSAVLRRMRQLSIMHFDEWDEINATELAKSTAHSIGHPEWLEDDHHWVWDLALKIHDEWNRKMQRTAARVARRFSR
jgi:hypothetical protein